MADKPYSLQHSENPTARRQALRDIAARRDAVLMPGAGNALTARIIEDLGFEAVYLTGAGLTNMTLGLPDLALLTPADLADATARISDTCSLPLLVDMDTGFGNALNAYHNTRRLERAGAAGLQIEDQVFPKKCGHFGGKAVVPVAEILGKLKACLDARQDETMMICARTDARAVEGFDAAMERAQMMIETGADLIFFEAPESLEEIQAIAKLPAPGVLNLVVGGRTPMPAHAELKAAGFSFVLYANAALQASVHAMQEVLGSLHATGSLDAVADKLASFSERQRLVGKPELDSLAARYEGS
ncbi:MAG: isocitrate lyase/phosphoenolpyruvate mutase family protein [Vannielia sp.]|uniref:isocitrate lyase/PEP mutase family protein n=1 Tax=Vannielia sp. TaxID=2813045 RepID=UPI003B8D28F8